MLRIATPVTALCGLLLISCSREDSRPSRNYHPNLNLPPVIKGAAYAPLPLGSIKPQGWLKEQLQLQASGLSGHIEEVWKDLGPDNGWKGGGGESWERAPYYLDGLVPLAFQLDDPRLLSKMQVWIDWNLEHQRPDGSFGPDRPRDWWPDWVFLKVMIQYGEASGDERVEPFIRRYLDYFRAKLPERRLDSWRRNRPYDEQAKGMEDLVGPSDRWQFYRWQEMAQILVLLSSRFKDPSLLETARELRRQGYDWEAHFLKFRYQGKTPRDAVFLASHGVNNAMGLRAPMMAWWLEGGEARRKAALEAFKTLHKFHGQVNGSFGCDEHLAGLSPSQGSETCSVVEEMYSLESMGWMLGELWVFDALERLAFNALPASMDEALWTHQYDQQVNQVLVSKAWREFTSNGESANLFGLEPEWGCCTANYHQGWPKFVSHMWMATKDGGLAAMSYAPCSVRVFLPSGRGLSISQKSDYPFDGYISIGVNMDGDEGEEFPLYFRVPLWSSGMSVAIDEGGNAAWQMHYGKPGELVVLKRIWKRQTGVFLNINMESKVEAVPGGISVLRGPVLAALDLDPRLEKRGNDPWSDRWLSTEAPWALGLNLAAGNVLPNSVEAPWARLKGNPFDRSTPPFVLKLKARRLKNWQMVMNSAAPPPDKPEPEGPEIEARLIPYGAAKLRIAVFPALP